MYNGLKHTGVAQQIMTTKHFTRHKMSLYKQEISLSISMPTQKK